MRAKMLALFLASAFFASAASMPQFPTLSMDVKRNEVTIVFGPPRATPSITGAPYSAEEVMEHTFSLPDGTYETKRSVIGHYCRDSQGRMRVEEAWKAAPFWTTEIFDPVQGFAYVLDEQNNVAHRMALQPAALVVPATTTSQGAVQPETTTMKLGIRTIEGVTAEGTRTTTTIPRGAVREGLPQTFTVETWESKELKLTLLTVSSNGYSSWLTHLSRAEPDRSRLQPPAGYTVVDDKESFTMRAKLQ